MINNVFQKVNEYKIASQRITLICYPLRELFFFDSSILFYDRKLPDFLSDFPNKSNLFPLFFFCEYITFLGGRKTTLGA